MKKQEQNERIEKVYRYVILYTKDNGFPPSVREIAQNLNIKSTATVYSYLKKLQKMELIDKSPMKNRAIKISSTSIKTNSIPLLGTVSAGLPLFAVENLEGYYPLPPNMSNADDCFALRVKGDSMINAGIFDKDIIIIKKQNYAENGEIVVALVDDSATVKRFFVDNNQIILHPENDTMQDMIFDSVIILGVVKELYRKF